MEGFAVLNRAKTQGLAARYPIRGRIMGVRNLIGPYEEEIHNFNGITGCRIRIPEGFEKVKRRRGERIGIKRYGYVLSMDYSININQLFHVSCLIRALDFYTISLGCDLRLNEVVIADAATPEGKNAFKLLLPIARRIILITDRRDEVKDMVDYGIMKYGTSAAVLEDPVKASERADAVVIASDNPKHSCLIERERPILYLKFINYPTGKLWFDDITVSFNGQGHLEPLFAQGYVDVLGKKPLWRYAEKEGFKIRELMNKESCIMEK